MLDSNPKALDINVKIFTFTCELRIVAGLKGVPCVSRLSKCVCAASVHGLFVQPELPQRKWLWILVVILETNPGQTTCSRLQTEAALWRWSERVTGGGKGQSELAALGAKGNGRL